MKNAILLEEKVTIWHHIGLPKIAGIYIRQSPENNDIYYCYYDSELKLWLKDFFNKNEAEQYATNWMFLSTDLKKKNINKMASAWQKLTWCENK